jgi:hypothetical protein
VKVVKDARSFVTKKCREAWVFLLENVKAPSLKTNKTTAI